MSTQKTIWWVQQFIIKISACEFDQLEIASQGFHKQRQVTDIRKIDVNKVMLSDKVTGDGRLSGRWENDHTVFYQYNKEYNIYVLSQYDKDSSYTMLFGVSEVTGYFEKLATEHIKREGKNIHGKLKTWKELIFMVNMTCIATQRQC